jgi:hypothetical protein
VYFSRLVGNNIHEYLNNYIYIYICIVRLYVCYICTGEKNNIYSNALPVDKTSDDMSARRWEYKRKKIKPFPHTALSVLSTTPRLFLLSKTFRVELRLSRSVTRNRIRLHATEFNNTVAVCSSATCAAADTANGYYTYIHFERARVHTISSGVVIILFSCFMYT